MPKFPHEYTIREWQSDHEREFEQAVIIIRELGKEEYFFSKKMIYFSIDGWKYWTMGSPVNETIVINRTVLEGILPSLSEQQLKSYAHTRPIKDEAKVITNEESVTPAEENRPEYLLDRYRGCLLGLATGDALGTTLEFKSPGSFQPIKEMAGGGPFRLKPGEWTDDTSLALCLASSLVETGRFDPADQMGRYGKWRDEGYMSSNGRCFDIGTTTNAALSKYQATGNPFSGINGPRSAGNGSIMRLAPVPLFFARDPKTAIQYCADSSRTTHGDIRCIDACRYLGALIIGALNGVAKDILLSDHFSPVPGLWDEEPLCPDIYKVAAGSFKNKEPPEIAGTGYVVKSLEAAIWAFHKSKSFEEGCLLAINLGDDADTTGAVYGQLAGAYYGYSGIPARWTEKLALKNELEILITVLYKQSRYV
ncbi:MAG: ADP-ribosylglycohydrolase family protein [Methanomicrobiales archaeon]|nr:ADP-ribosylglycohydrolase family protein [Methanomicrobiales archaeon]